MRSLVFLLLLVTLGSCGTASDGPEATSSGAPETPAVGDSPIIEVESAEALVQDLDDLDAETVVLNVWATWCMPCVAEFPHFVQYDREMNGKGVEVRFVSVDDPNVLPDVRAFLDQQNVTEPSFLYTGDTDLVSQFNPMYGGSVPITLILDQERVVRHMNLGTMSYEMLADAVSAVQRGEAPAGSETEGT